MKRAIIVLIIIIAFTQPAIAESYANMSIDDLISYRDALLEELSAVNAAILDLRSQQIKQVESVDAQSIKELFPDEDFALYIRDTLGKLSINDTVSQDELDSITTIRASYDGDITDLTGISHLRNLTSLSITPYKSGTITEELLALPHLKGIDLSYFNGPSLPSWFTQMVQLEWIEFAGSSLVSLPDSIGDMTNLTYIMLNNSTEFSYLPESIGQCIDLESLYLGNTSISSLPDTLGNCTNLTNLEAGYTSISELPQSILDLHIKNLGISHTNIM